MCKGNVVIGNVVEEVEFVLVEEKTGCDGVDRSIAPALVKETTLVVEVIEEVNVSRRAEPGGG